MHDTYCEIFEMAHKLKLPLKPKWYDRYGCPRWQEPEEELQPFIKKIQCQRCGQIFNVCLVHPVYHSYNTLVGCDKLPDDWHYGDAPSHPDKDKWEPYWWDKGWDVICAGVTMNSSPIVKGEAE